MTVTKPVLRLRGRARAIWVNETLLIQLGPREVRVAPFGENELRDLHTLRMGCDSEFVDSSTWMRQLRDGGFLEELVPASGDLDIERFDRLLNFLSELELRGRSRFELLQRLRTAHVVVVGLGGLASWVVYNLLCCGIGRFTLIDGDHVELSNLNRSILFTESDVGRPKVDAALDAMLRFNPRTEVTRYQMLVSDPDDLAEVMKDGDLLIGLADQPPWLIKEWVAVAAQRAGKPVLQSSGSRVGPFRRTAEDACSVCDWSHQLSRQPLYGEMLRRQARLPRGDSGALSPLGAMTGGFVAIDVVRYLLGLNPLTANKIWEMGGDFTTTFRECPKHPQCGSCGDTGADLLAPPSQAMED